MEKSLDPARDKLGEGQKSISRRKFLGLAAGAALAGVALACKVARKEEKTEKEETPSPRCVFGELIDNDIHVLVTDPAGDNPPILRKNLSLDDSEEHWYVKAGVVVEGQKMTGPIYH